MSIAVLHHVAKVFVRPHVWLLLLQLDLWHVVSILQNRSRQRSERLLQLVILTITLHRSLREQSSVSSKLTISILELELLVVVNPTVEGPSKAPINLVVLCVNWVGLLQ